MGCYSKIIEIGNIFTRICISTNCNFVDSCCKLQKLYNLVVGWDVKFCWKKQSKFLFCFPDLWQTRRPRNVYNAAKFMSQCQLMQCMLEHIAKAANVLFAENLSPDPGFCKGTSELTQVLSFLCNSIILLFISQLTVLINHLCALDTTLDWY